MGAATYGQSTSINKRRTSIKHTAVPVNRCAQHGPTAHTSIGNTHSSGGAASKISGVRKHGLGGGIVQEAVVPSHRRGSG